MRIGIEATETLVQQKTGIERYATELVRALIGQMAAHSDLELYLYFHKGNEFVNSRALGQHLPDRSPRVRSRFYALRKGYGLALPAMVRADRLHLLHLLEPRVPRFKPCPILLTVHDVGWARLPQEARRIGGAARQPHAQRAIRMADGFLAVSHSTASDLEQICALPSDRIWIVHEGVDHILGAGSSEAVPTACKYGLEQYILCVGALQYRKNLVRLLQAYKVLKSRYQIAHTLALAGRDGPGCEQVYSAVKDLGLQDDVRFLGYVPDEDLRGLYSEADLYVYPSIYEGFGIPILEALSCDTVVAASRASSIPEVGGDALIYFDPYDIEEMAAAIHEGLTNQSLRDDLRSRGRQRAGQFTWRHTAQETIGTYRELVGRKQSI